MITNPGLISLIKIGTRLNMLFLILSVYPNPGKSISVLKQLISIRRNGEKRRTVQKFIKNGNRIHHGINVPGWPSSNFNHFIKNEARRLGNSKNSTNRIQTVFFEITNRCSLNCKHCSNSSSYKRIGPSSENNNREAILQKIIDAGIPHIQFTGGEPLEEFDTLLSLIRKAGRSETWVLSSGFGLTEEKAHRLKEAGLIGINISLDHWDEEKHNRFRGNNKAYSQVKMAVNNGKKAGLLVSLSLCATKEFTTKENLDKFLKLSREWEVHFVRILEPKQTGSFVVGDVRLSSKQLLILEEFFYSEECNRRDKSTPLFM